MANLKSIIGVDEIKNYERLLPQLFAEFLGTFILLTAALMADLNLEPVTVGLGAGMLLASIVQIIGNVSGGHVNPAVTVGVLVMGNMKILKALCYIAVQIVAGILGAAVSYALTPNDYTPGMILNTRTSSIFALELLLSFILVAVVISVTDQDRGAKGLGSAPLAIGLAFTTGICLCGRVYTVSMNPLRILSPAVIGGTMKVPHSHTALGSDWSFVGVYCVGPLVGGMLAGVVYRFILNWKSNTSEDLISSPQTD